MTPPPGFLNQKKNRLNASRMAGLSAENSAKQREVELLSKQLEDCKREHQRQLDELNRRNERDKAELQAMLDRQFAERLRLVQEQLGTTTERLLKQRSEELDKTNRTQMDSMLAPLKAVMAEMKKSMDDNRESFTRSTASLSEQLRQMHASATSLGVEAEKLSRALQAGPNDRGCGEPRGRHRRCHPARRSFRRCAEEDRRGSGLQGHRHPVSPSRTNSSGLFPRFGRAGRCFVLWFFRKVLQGVWLLWFSASAPAARPHPPAAQGWQVSTADNPISKTYAFEAGQRAIEAHLLRCGEYAEVLPELDRGFYRVRYKMQGNPKISILIPNKDHIKDLEKCLESISRSDYKNYEIIIIENNSEKAETFAYYKTIESDHIRILRWDGPFNYSAINNYAVSETDGEYLVLLNNDTEVIGKDWLEEMLANCQRKEVGIVGAKLYYPGGQVQHAGVIVGIRGIAGNMFRGLPKGYSGYLHKASTQQDLSAVTAACMMVKRSVYEEVGGFEERLAVAFNDIDFCLKVRRCGYLVVYDPYVELYHYESRSRGAEDNEEKIRRYQCEIDYVRRTWSEIMEKGDPMYNPNLTLVKCDYSLREKEDG